jgi:hypothetical protein
MSGRFPRHNYDDVFDAIQGFVYELRQEPAWSEELDRRATFLEKGCGAGSPWREVADKAVELLPDAIETDRFCWTAVFLSKTGKKKPYWRITETTVGVFSQLQNVITLVKQLLDIEGLSSSARAALKEWLRQSVDLRDKAVSLKADGCQLLYLIYSDSKKPMTTGKKPIKVPSGKKAIKKAMEEAAKNAMEAQSGAESLLKTVPKLFQPVHYAVDSMAAWVAEHPVAPDAQPDGNGGPEDDSALIPATGMPWQEAAERLENLRSQGEPFTSQQKLAKQLLCSSQTINKAIHNTPSLKVWANVEQKKSVIPKAQSINEVVTDRTPQSQEIDPVDEAAIREFIEKADPETKAWFLALSQEDQLAYLDDPGQYPKILGRKP